MRLFSFVLFGVLLVKFLNCVQTAINYKYLHSFVESVVSSLQSCQEESWFIHCQGSVFAISWIIVFTVDVEWVETCFPVREVFELGTVRMCVCVCLCICCFNIWLVLQQSRGLDQGKCAAAWWKAAPPPVPSYTHTHSHTPNLLPKLLKYSFPAKQIWMIYCLPARQTWPYKYSKYWPHLRHRALLNRLLPQMALSSKLPLPTHMRTLTHRASSSIRWMLLNVIHSVPLPAERICVDSIILLTKCCGRFTSFSEVHYTALNLLLYLI